jgi:two-component system, OmpR family, sensor histidine kinase SenX3
VDSGAVVALIALSLLLGLGLGVLAARGRGAGRSSAPPPAPADEGRAEPDLANVLDVLRSAAVVLDDRDEAVVVNPPARAMGLVRGRSLVVTQLARLVRATRTDGEQRVAEVDLPRRGRLRETTALRARVVRLRDPGHVCLLVEDISEARRVDAVRRDFVANVSHELKTPVGAMSLLAEALLDAADDPAAVRRFASRMQRESLRLSRLVQELIDLSRLQGADPLPEVEEVSVDAVVAEAVDRNRMTAAARRIELVSGGEPGVTVLGSETQLVTALSNLLDNAIAYSPESTRVAVGVRRREDAVEVSVTDSGIGIAESDLERVFERFYRADPARSRATGGTGLGLAIVKHVAGNHGGSVSVWSIEGEGSTFTLRLPTPAPPAPPPPETEEPDVTPSATVSVTLRGRS